MAKILIVDDSRMSRTLLKSMLQLMGHEIIGEASNGLDALESYKTLRPDLVTMDLVMPGISGLEALKGILDCNSQAAVVMVTANSQITLDRGCVEAGARAVLRKPFNSQELEAVLSLALQ